MSMEVMPLFSTLGLNVSPYAQGMMQATSIASIFPSTVQSFMANPLLGVIDLAKQVTRSIISMVTEGAGALDDLGDKAANLGLAVKDLSSFERVAKLSGVEGAGEALKFLQRAAADANSGNKALIQTFADLGVGTAQPTMEDCCMAWPMPWRGSRTRTKRTDLAMTLFGRSGSQLVGTISQGSTALRQMMRGREPRWGMCSMMPRATAAGKFTGRHGHHQLCVG